MNALGELAPAAKIEDGQLLRRMIARRCVYGVDVNPLSVQLARLAVWIHTFVPGLPLSVLDHTLVHGNSLVGVGTVDEIRGKFAEAYSSYPLYAVDADQLLARRPRRSIAWRTSTMRRSRTSRWPGTLSGKRRQRSEGRATCVT